ncbi:MAG: protein phosphatase 2C domain-containing protein [Bacteroidaceae bacterium]|nr:protein phosphatase 2C domain-containing protein [Bacteroidaceae bacterium]
MKISLYPPLSIHEIGQRPNQEDSIAQWDNRLFVLCDGMGGHEKGEVASQTICQSLVKWFEEIIKDDSFTDEQLHEALKYAYIELDKFDDGSLRKMGTTLTLLYIYNKGVTAAHIGDSRIYHIRPSEGILYQSRDHSLVYDLYQSGEITYEEMLHYPQKNIITRAITPGIDNRMRPDIIHITDVQPGDYFYLCSDGMLEQMSNDELLTLLSSDATDEEKQKQLIEATINNQDNHSAWLIQVKDVIKEEGDEEPENEEPISRCNAINILPQSSQSETIEQVAEPDDVQIASDEDVVMVSEPPTPKKKQIPFLKWNKWIIAAILFVILIAACFAFFGDDDKEDENMEQKEQMMQSPVMPSYIDDSKRDINNDSTRNQHTIDA